MVSIESPRESDLCIAQIIDFYATGNTTDGMYMHVRWFYTKSQLSVDVPLIPLSDQLLFNDIRRNELLLSDHIECMTTHVLNIIERINVAQTKLEYSRIIQNGGMFRNKKTCKALLRKQSGTFCERAVTHVSKIKRVDSNYA